MKNALKSIGGSLVGILIFGSVVFSFILLLKFGAKIAFTIEPVISKVAAITLLVNIVIVLPLLLFRKIKPYAALFMFVSSFIFGIATWLYGFAVTYSFLGVGWLIAGLLLGGVGVVPLGIIGAAIHGRWLIAGSLVLSFIITIGLRAISQNVIEQENGITQTNHDNVIDISDELEDWDVLNTRR